jgi:hypothetical protein
LHRRLGVVVVVVVVGCRTNIYVLEIRKPLAFSTRYSRFGSLSSLSTRQANDCTVVELFAKTNRILKINYKFIANFE